MKNCSVTTVLFQINNHYFFNYLSLESKCRPLRGPELPAAVTWFLSCQAAKPPPTDIFPPWPNINNFLSVFRELDHQGGVVWKPDPWSDHHPPTGGLTVTLLYNLILCYVLPPVNKLFELNLNWKIHFLSCFPVFKSIGGYKNPFSDTSLCLPASYGPG